MSAQFPRNPNLKAEQNKICQTGLNDEWNVMEEDRLPIGIQ